MKLLYCVAITIPLVYSQSYLNVKSEEINSQEHGQKEGVKTTNCSCGWTNKARIVGGKETLKNEFPLMAGIMDVEIKKLFCGATIITTNHALTASHCTYPFKVKNIALVIGAHNLTNSDDDTADIIDIKETIEHENYKPYKYHYDIALLVLTRSIKYTQHVGPACLPASRTNLLNQNLKVLGWGKLHNKGKTSEVLMKVNLRYVPINECSKNYTNREFQTDDPYQFCTFRHEKDSCQGDSGGPVIWLDPDTNRYTLVGLVSFGKMCGSVTPGVNTDVSYFLPWIQAKIASTGLPGETCAKVD